MQDLQTPSYQNFSSQMLTGASTVDRGAFRKKHALINTGETVSKNASVLPLMQDDDKISFVK